MTEAEIAWAAGLFEGEGTIYPRRRPSGRCYAYLLVTSSDLDVLERFASLTSAKIYARKTETAGHYGRKQMYQCVVTRSALALELVTLFEPWLGQRRLEQIARTRAAILANPPDGHRDGRIWKARLARYGRSGGNYKDPVTGRFTSREAVITDLRS